MKKQSDSLLQSQMKVPNLRIHENDYEIRHELKNHSAFSLTLSSYGPLYVRLSLFLHFGLTLESIAVPLTGIP